MKKRVLFDTNVILDLLLERHPFFPGSAAALNLASQGRVHGFVAAHAVTTLFFILARKGNPERARNIMAELLKTLSVAQVSEKVVRAALSSKIKDFEDAVTHFAALEERVAMIVSRNIKDFSKSDIPVVLPEVFFSSLFDIGKN